MLTNERGFSLLELIVIGAIAAVLAGIAVGVTGTIVRASRGDAGAQQLDGFLKRTREAAIARRRDIEVHFEPPNRVVSRERAVPPPGTTDLETLTFEGGIEYRLTDGVADTPNFFGNATEIAINGVAPVMFTPEGALLDAGQNPVNVTISLGIEGDPLSASAVTILGSTANVERWRWNGAQWTK